MLIICLLSDTRLSVGLFAQCLNSGTGTQFFKFLLRFPQWLSGKESTCSSETQEMWIRSLRQEEPLEEEMATHYSILA